MSQRTRDLLSLLATALVARAVAVALVPWPPFTDPAYYALVAQRLAEGHGFTIPVLYSFLEVGSRIPDPAVLPVPSNGHWMPLTSIVAAGSMAVFGSSYVAATVPLIFLSAALAPFTYWITVELGARRGAAVAAGILAIFAGPLLIMYPTTDNFAVFGVTGAASLYAATRVASAQRPGPWFVAGGLSAGFASLARIDGVLLTVGVATAWFVRRGWSPWRPERSGGATVGWGAASAMAYLAVLSPWLARNGATYGTALPSTGGHTLWIRSYNEQFSIGHEVSLSTYLDWGWTNIIGSKVYAFGELIGRTGVLLGGTFLFFFVAGAWMRRRDPRLAPVLIYVVVMFLTMALVFTFHAPRGAFYHSSPAWLPWALAIAVTAVGPVATAAGRLWPFLRRPATHRFLTVAGVAGAMVLSVTGSAILYQDWSHSRNRDEQVAAFLLANAPRTDVVMASDPASLYPLSGNPGVAAPFDPFPVIAKVIDAYGVDWVVVLSPGDGEPDPLGLWDGSAAIDSQGNRATFLPERPDFEGDDVRIFRVER